VLATTNSLSREASCAILGNLKIVEETLTTFQGLSLGHAEISSRRGADTAKEANESLVPTTRRGQSNAGDDRMDKRLGRGQSNCRIKARVI
jgi:hypothetical protein